MKVLRKLIVEWDLVSLFLVIFGIFVYTVAIRQDRIGDISLQDRSNLQWITASTIKFADNWYNEGLLTTQLAMLEYPPDVEFPDVSSRMPYVSYTPASSFPIYIISSILNTPPSARIVIIYNMMNHFAVALLLSLTAFYFAGKVNFNQLSRLLISVIPGAIFLMLPGPLYWMQMTYFSDQGVLIFVAAYLLLESVYLTENVDYSKTRWLIALLGCLFDWYFFFFLFSIFIVRLVIKGRSVIQLMPIVKFLSAPVLAVVLFSLHVTLLNSWPAVVEKFFERSGTNNFESQICNSTNARDLSHLNTVFIENIIKPTLGEPAALIIGLGFLTNVVIVVYLIMVRRKQSLVHRQQLSLLLSATALTLAIAGMSHSYVLVCHATEHPFSHLKFGLLLALGCFVLTPLSLLSVVAYLKLKHKGYLSFVAILMAFVSTIYIVAYHHQYSNFYPEKSPELIQLAYFIKQDASYKDVYFSPHIEILPNPPMMMAYARKPVHLITNQSDMLKYIENLSQRADNFVVKIVIDNNRPIPAWVMELKTIAQNTTRSDSLNHEIWNFNQQEITALLRLE